MPPNLVAAIIELGQKRKNDELKELLEKTKSKYVSIRDRDRASPQITDLFSFCCSSST